MIYDTVTIMQKELKELLFLRLRFKGGLVGFLIFIGVFGVFMPLQSGISWVENPISLISWSWIPFLLITGVIADSFAGERERHTLETLLASRLSDHAILFGKISAAILYGWGLTMICLVLSLVSFNIAYSKGDLILYPPEVMIAAPILSLLVAGLATGLGVIVSLRAATVRQAQQTFSIAFFMLFIPMFAIPFLPENLMIRAALFIMKVNIEMVAIYAAIFIFLVDGLLLLISMKKFQRNRLILD